MSEEDDADDRATAADLFGLIGRKPGDATFLRLDRQGELRGVPDWVGDLGQPDPYVFEYGLPSPDDVAGAWVQVSRGGLLEPIRLRINRSPDGRFIVTGLIVGRSGRQEITSDTLRGIRLGAIMRALFADFDPATPPARNEWDPDDDGWDQMAWSLFKELVYDDAAPTPDKQEMPPDPLREFAETYLRELARQPRRAMTAAAEAHHVSRATANRWAQRCRELGYLPSRQKRSEPES